MKRNIYFFFRIIMCFLLLLQAKGYIMAANKADTLVTERLEQIDISLLTCEPHEEVYSLYGHTAIRINNKLSGEDYVINYGVFDTTMNFFVLRFIFGLTDYTMMPCSFKDFIDEYKSFGSGVYEQRINMSPREKIQFFIDLAENAKPENVIYRYNYFYNNCTTKARDILLNSLDGEVKYTPLTHLQQGKRSFRQLIHVGNGEYRWTMFGNDILLGIGSDANTTHDERQFLPRVLSEDFDSAKIVYPDGREKALVDTAYWVLPAGKKWRNEEMNIFPYAPTQCALAFLLCMVIFSLVEYFIIGRPLLWVHYAVYALYAFVGLFLFLMLFSQHPTVRINLQILIFNPLFFYFALPKNIQKLGKYAILSCLALFFLGNILQCYAEGVNIMAVALLVTFLPILFCRVKKI